MSCTSFVAATKKKAIQSFYCVGLSGAQHITKKNSKLSKRHIFTKKQKTKLFFPDKDRKE